ncbi:MAG: protein kinase [Chloroflexi bacterium]|nr:protein kinase [Chloroflexota bacterium]
MTSAPRFGPELIGPKLGDGDMGAVYKAGHVETREMVALKILDQFDLPGQYDREAAVELIEFAGTLQHPRLHPIIAALESEEAGGRIGIVMPLATGGSLWDHLKSGRKIPPREAWQLIASIANGVNFLHGQEVAHGSLKPSNVLLDNDGTPTLTDLPMAHLRESGLVPPQPTELHQHFLRLESDYNSPPTIQGDVFALAGLTYTILAGRLPFNDPHPNARSIPEPAGLPAAIYSVLLRGLTNRTQLRYPSVVAFLQDLKGAREGKIDPQTAQWFTVTVDEPSEEE